MSTGTNSVNPWEVQNAWDGNWNTDPNYTANFDAMTSLPPNVSQNFDVVQQKIIALTNYIANNPANLNGLQAYMTLLTNIQNASQLGGLTGAQMAQVQTMLGHDIENAGGASLGTAFADMIVDSTWFLSSGSQSSCEAQTLAAISQLRSQLNQLGGLGSAFVNAAQQELTVRQGSIGDFFDQNWDSNNGCPAVLIQDSSLGGGSDYYVDYGPNNSTSFWNWEQGQIGTGFIANSNVSDVVNDMQQDSISYLCANVKNKELLLQLLLLKIMFPQGELMTQNEGGVANGLNALTKCQQQLTTILNEFKTGITPQGGGSAGQWQPNAAKAFMTALNQLQQIADTDPSLAGQVSSIVDGAVGNLNGIALVDANGKPAPIQFTLPPTPDHPAGQTVTLNTLGDAMKAYMQSAQSGSPNNALLQAMATTLTQINPSVPQTDPTPPTPAPSFQTFTSAVQDLNQAITSVQDESQVTSTKLSAATNNLQQFWAMLKAVGQDGLIAQENFILSAIQSASKG